MQLFTFFWLRDDLALEVRGDVGEVQPAASAFADELGEAYLPLGVHLPYEVEESVVVDRRAADDVGGTAQEVVAVGDAAHEFVEARAAVARGHLDGCAPRLAYGVEELSDEYVQQVEGTLGRAVVDALAQRRGAGGQFGNTEIGAPSLPPLYGRRYRPRGSIYF